MTISVSDARSNPNDQISHAVAIIGRSKHRADVFTAIYFGKKRFKTVSEIAKETCLPPKRVLEEAKKLSSNDIVHQTKIAGATAYEKDKFYAAQKGKILSFVKNPRKLKNLPTKTRPRPFGSAVEIIQVKAKSISVSQITVDDIDSFSKVSNVNGSISKAIPMAESRFKNGIMRILKETGKFKDWGGEKNDLCSTRLRFQGKRRATAFAFKGKGLVKKKLTPNFMGKNGDQIQRLFQSPAEIFLLQYWSQIDDSVLEQMQMAAKVRSYSDGKKIYYGVIDGQDSTRIIQAYPNEFGKS
jgi:hypothetical protein